MKIRLSHPSIGEVAFPIAEGGQVILGRRGGGSGVEMNWDPKISRRHARVWVERGTLWVEDLGSRNGTWIDGNRLNTPLAIDPGQRVRVGSTALERGDAAVGTGDSTRSLHGPSLDLMSAKTAVEARPSMSSASDLSVAPLPEPRPVPDVRFIAEGVVGIAVESRDAFRQLWEGDLAKTGLFVPSNITIEFGAQVDLRFRTPDGVLPLRAAVVHVVDAAMAERLGMDQGVGLQLVDVDAATRERAERYASGDVPTFDDHALDGRSSEEIRAAFATAKRLIAYVERDEYYQAIDLPSGALQSEVDARLVQIQQRLSTDDLSPPQAARMAAARRSLRRAEEVLGTPERRLRFDFANGDIDAEARLRAAADRLGPDAGKLRRAWIDAHPKRVENAQHLLKRAFAFRRERQFEEALELGREAQKQDPFWLELRRTVETWESLANHSIAI